jgi:hypothetical protein
VEEIQAKYDEVIRAGLQKGALIKADGKILVKEK